MKAPVIVGVTQTFFFGLVVGLSLVRRPPRKQRCGRRLPACVCVCVFASRVQSLQLIRGNVTSGTSDKHLSFTQIRAIRKRTHTQGQIRPLVCVAAQTNQPGVKRRPLGFPTYYYS